MLSLEHGRGVARSFKNAVLSGAGVLVVSAFWATGLAADGASSDLSETYVGIWCGEDLGQRWQTIVADDGTYTQSNQSLADAEQRYEPHVEAGSWSIDGTTLRRQLASIQYEGEEPRLVEPNWEFEFQIVSLTPEELVVRYEELDLTITSRKDCSAF